MDTQFHPTLHRACDYLSMFELKLIQVSKIDLWPNITLYSIQPINYIDGT